MALHGCPQTSSSKWQLKNTTQAVARHNAAIRVSQLGRMLMTTNYMPHALEKATVMCAGVVGVILFVV